MAAIAGRALSQLRRLAARLLRLAARARRAVAGSPGVSRQLRIAMLVALLALLSAAAAFAVTTMLVDSGGISASPNSAHAWLGLDVTGSPLGIMATDVVPAGPAGKAGLQPGDLITSINNQPVGTVDAVNASLAGLHSGDKVAIQFTRGVATYTTQATLALRPPGHP
ncbi:MAG: PDZ domain-containing protein [Actinomycetota bacterium]|nr:PDZ domain-containing protein [Actinomycetota bacterium]